MLDMEKLEVKINPDDNIFTILKKIKKVAIGIQKDSYLEMIKELETVQSIRFLETIKEYFILIEEVLLTRTAPEGTCSQCGCTANDCKECIAAQGFPCSLDKTGICSRCARENYVGKCTQCASTIEWVGKGKGRYPTIVHLPDCPAIIKASFEN